MDFREYTEEREPDLLRYLSADAVLSGVPAAALFRDIAEAIGAKA